MSLFLFSDCPPGKFFQYSYTDPGTGTCGNVVAYSLDDSFRRDVVSGKNNLIIHAS